VCHKNRHRIHAIHIQKGTSGQQRATSTFELPIPAISLVTPFCGFKATISVNDIRQRRTQGVLREENSSRRVSVSLQRHTSGQTKHCFVFSAILYQQLFLSPLSAISPLLITPDPLKHLFYKFYLQQDTLYQQSPVFTSKCLLIIPGHHSSSQEDSRSSNPVRTTSGKIRSRPTVSKRQTKSSTVTHIPSPDRRYQKPFCRQWKITPCSSFKKTRQSAELSLSSFACCSYCGVLAVLHSSSCPSYFSAPLSIQSGHYRHHV
jgi:hypothetical protein